MVALVDKVAKVAYTGGMTSRNAAFKPIPVSTPPGFSEEPGRNFHAPGPGLDASAWLPGPRARAILRGVKIAREDLRASGGAYDLEQVRDLLHGVSRQSIDKRVGEGGLLAVPGPGNKRYYPAVQFTDDGEIVEGLKQALTALPTKSGFAALNFLIHPDERLGGRKPIDMLKAGEIDPVVEAARRVGEQGA